MPTTKAPVKYKELRNDRGKMSLPYSSNTTLVQKLSQWTSILAWKIYMYQKILTANLKTPQNKHLLYVT
jgi:hypothetical protein